MSETTQQAVLQECVNTGTSVRLFLMNGFQLQGTITKYDSSVVVLVSEGKQQMIYKHAISTLVPVRPLKSLSR